MMMAMMRMVNSHDHHDNGDDDNASTLNAQGGVNFPETLDSYSTVSAVGIICPNLM